MLAAARARLREAGIDGGDLDARLLVGDALGLDAAALILRGDRSVAEDARARIAASIERRAAGEPVHRILGRRAFYAHEFRLSPATLEPRPDTETLVELCRAPMAGHIERKGACLFVDVGTGTGAIAVSLLALFPAARAIAVDISAEALETAAQNAADAGVAGRFRPLLGDHLTALDVRVDMIVSNPPYIPTGDLAGLPREVQGFDPILALDGGPDGLRSYRALAEQAGAVLRDDGEVAVEIGIEQGESVRALFLAAGFAIDGGALDLAGTERALLFRRERAASTRPSK